MQFKICPRCQAQYPLNAPMCGACGHHFRTKFGQSPPRQTFQSYNAPRWIFLGFGLAVIFALVFAFIAPALVKSSGDGLSDFKYSGKFLRDSGGMWHREGDSRFEPPIYNNVYHLEAEMGQPDQSWHGGRGGPVYVYNLKNGGCAMYVIDSRATVVAIYWANN